MKVKVNFEGLRRSKWYEYVLRFAFGGAISAITGLIAEHFGAAIGGLFLAFPAILPATATLIEKHEKQKKEQAKMSVNERGRKAAGLDALGAAMGSIGLLAFAIIVWKAIPTLETPIVLFLATFVWFVIALVIWAGREKLLQLGHRHRATAYFKDPTHSGVSSLKR